MVKWKVEDQWKGTEEDKMITYKKAQKKVEK